MSKYSEEQVTQAWEAFSEMLMTELDEEVKSGTLIETTPDTFRVNGFTVSIGCGRQYVAISKCVSLEADAYNRIERFTATRKLARLQNEISNMKQQLNDK